MDSSNEDKNKKPAPAEPTTKDKNPARHDRTKKLSPMIRKFMKGGAFIPSPDRDNFIGFRPHYIFLYGTLMDPAQLQKVLRLETTPSLRPATITGWKMMLWGAYYPALVFKSGNLIHGMAYEVQKESHMEYLKHYETEAYTLHGCMINFPDDQTEIPGETFIYDGDRDLLREGGFDLKDWQMEKLEEEE